MNILTPKDNYNIDTRPDDIKGLNKIADYVRDQESKEKSISNVVTQSYTPDPELRPLLYTDGSAGYVQQLWSNQTDPMTKLATGFASPFPSLSYPYFFGLQNPSLLKITNVGEVALTTKLSYYDIPYVGGSSNASSSYSVKGYISLYLYEPYTSSSWLTPLTFLETTFTYDPATFIFTITPSEWNRSMSNISTDTMIDGGDTVQDFNTNPTGISQSNYNKLISQNNQLLISVGFDSTEVNALSGYDIGAGSFPWLSNKAHFKESFIGDFATVSPTRKLLFTLNFNYFGLLSPYTPNS